MPRIFVRLANPAHKLPIPERGGRLAPQDRAFAVDDAAPFWVLCLADGSVVRAEPPVEPTPAKPAASKEKA